LVFSVPPAGRRGGVSGALGLVEVRLNEANHRIRQVFLTPTDEEFVSMLDSLPNATDA
jgi:hypothetical protein